MPRTKKIATDISSIENTVENTVENIITNNILTIENKPTCSEVPQKLKRGRKSKKELEISITNDITNENIILSQNEDTPIEINIVQEVNVPIKKRGRKPKGGKIILQTSNLLDFKETKPNVILHLKCSFKDLQTNLLDNSLNGYNIFTKNNEMSYEIISNNNSLDFKNNYDKIVKSNQLNQKQNVISTFNVNMQDDEVQSQSNNNIQMYNIDEETQNSNENKDIWKKLKLLQHNLHINNICDKKSACFWCTYEFDNPPIYIPKHFIKDTYHVYGCFCSPECATAFLMEENIDSSSRFERYHLLNNIYSKIYDFKKNIKPAPKPHYMLEKFYGNLTIQEYRSLLKNDRLFLVVDKPLTRILPELHEENDDFIINNKIIPSNTYQIKRKIVQKQNKNTILNEKFGL
jgi:hypothetical protein